MKNILTIILVMFSSFLHAQEQDAYQNKKGNGEFSYVLTKDDEDTEEKKVIIENVSLSEFFDEIGRISYEFKAQGYEITKSFSRHTPHGQKTPKLGKYELELTIQRDDQETQKRSFVFENVNYFEGNEKFKIQIDKLGEEGYNIVSYKKDFSTYESLEIKE